MARPRTALPKCRACEYSLSGLEQTVSQCPECGIELDWAAVEIGRRPRRAIAIALILGPHFVNLALMTVSPSDVEGRNDPLVLITFLVSWVGSLVTGAIGLDILLPRDLIFRNFAVGLGGVALGFVVTPVLLAIGHAFGIAHL